MVRDLYVPWGNCTMPPPAALAAAMARSIASSSNVDPLPLAPKSRTLNVPAACAGTWGSAMAAASTARPAAQGMIRLGMVRPSGRHRRCSKRMSGVAEGQGGLPRGATGSEALPEGRDRVELGGQRWRGEPVVDGDMRHGWLAVGPDRG